MDRRWMGIIIIFLVGALGIGMIVDTSDTVGQAVTVCNEMTVTIPDGFKLFLSNPTNTTLINNENETIFIKISTDTSSKDQFNQRYLLLKSDEKIHIDKVEHNGDVHNIHYTHLDKDVKVFGSYFEKDNRTIELRMNEFKDYDKNAKFIQDTIVHDFKQNKMD